MCDRDFRLPVGSRHGNFPHETFFSPGTNVAGGPKIFVPGEKKVSCGKFPRRDPTGNLKSRSHIFKFLYLTQLYFHLIIAQI